MSVPAIYEVCGIDPLTMEEDYPDIFTNGPTDEMWEKWDAEWGTREPLLLKGVPGVPVFGRLDVIPQPMADGRGSVTGGSC